MNSLKCLMLCVFLFPSFTYAYTNQAVECLAANIYHEARGEPSEGRHAVGYVTVNRMYDKRFPNTICDVVYQARYSKWWWTHHRKKVPVRNQCQFSWYCDGRPDDTHNQTAWRQALADARAVLDEAVPDPTNGSTHYHANYVSPYWCKNYQLMAIINNHRFYKRA